MNVGLRVSLVSLVFSWFPPFAAAATRVVCMSLCLQAWPGHLACLVGSCCPFALARRVLRCSGFWGLVSYPTDEELFGISRFALNPHSSVFQRFDYE